LPTAESSNGIRRLNEAPESDASVSGDRPTERAPRTHPAMPSVFGRTVGSVARFPEAVAASTAAVFVAVLTMYRLGAINDARFPGHADPAFYYNVAQRIHAGQGTTIDYTWEYLSGQHPLPQYAFGYWLPLPSAMMSVALHLRNSLAGALTLNVAMTVLLVVATYFLARGLSRAPWVPAVAAVLVSVQPLVSHFAVTSESPVYFAAFAVAAMAVAIRAQARVWLWPVAGVLAGLANLSRSEGLVLIAVLVVAAALSLRPGRRVAFVSALIVGYVLVMLPLYVQSERHFGSLLPPASGSFPFITDYNDLYALHVDHSLSALLGGGPWQFIDLRLSTLALQLTAGFRSMHPVDVCVILLLLGTGLASWRDAAGPARPMAAIRRAARSPWFVPVAYAAGAFAFYLLVAPVVAGAGAVAKGMVTIMPVLVVGALAQLAKFAVRPVVAVAFVVVLVLAPLNSIAGTTRAVIGANNGVGKSALALRPILVSEQRCLGEPTVLMTTAPWEVTQATGFRTVQIPYAPLDDVFRIARKYGVTDIQFGKSRPALHELSALAVPGGALKRVSVLNGGVYRITAAAPGVTC
jgi:hypothetical protein